MADARLIHPGEQQVEQFDSVAGKEREQAQRALLQTVMRE
jgi:hypothetical protein